MRIANSYTLNEYQENYSNLLEKFLLEYEDHDEFMFATIEIKKFYSGIIDIPAIEVSNEFALNFFDQNVQNELDKNGDLKFLEAAKKHNLSSFKIIDFLESKLSYFETKTPHTEPATENKHPNMFVNDSFKLFEYILNNHITENKGRFNDISFYYRKMYNDNYIIQKPYPFVEWFTKLYNVESFQIKTLNTIQNPNRLKHYSNSLDWFKLQNQ